MNSVSRPSMVGRALLALVLTIGFYGLALGIALGLLYFVYLEFFVFGRINVRFTIFGLIGAVVILWSIFPRIDRFIAPGPRLTRVRFPALFKEIERVASLTKQEMPREVYLVPDVNAFVTERGGIMGIGSKRVMGIGLPLFHLMTVDELSAIVAHEFGHFYGGDTALGPWVYKTRAAVIRTVMNVGQTNQWLLIPFEAYAKMFLRVTNAVSRQQEYSADQLAARTVGTQAIISGLQKVHKYGEAFSAFFQQEYWPVIEAGYKPPMLHGFEQFLKAPRITEIVNQSFEQQLTQGKADPYDTHPSLKERIAALEHLPPTGAWLSNYPASTLLTGSENLEYLILKHLMAQQKKADELKEIHWNDVAETAFVPLWEKNVQPFRQILTGMTALSLFDEAQNIPGLFERIAKAGKFLPPNVPAAQVPPDAQLQMASNIIGVACAYALRQNGWKIKTTPGEEIILFRDANEVRPFNFVTRIVGEKLSKEQWQTFCEDNKISDLRLIS